MIAWCSPNRVAEVRQNLQERIDNVQRKTRSEAQEEKYTGGTRVVWGEGGEVITLLQEDEFVAFTIEYELILKHQKYTNETCLGTCH